MKKRIVFLFLIMSSIINAQTSEDKISDKVNVDYYIGIGGQVMSKFEINDKLKSSNLPQIKEFMPEFQVGLNVFGEKFSGDAEFGFLFSKDNKGNSKIQDMAFSARLRAHYNIINKEKVAFTGGITLASTSSQVDIYSKNNIIDLNDLDPANNGGHVSIRNEVFYAGPSVAVYLFKNKSAKLRLNLGYELAFTNGKWKSDFASVNNTVKEIGNNRFVFGISIL